jgi:quercetin 2,3-dioxygenase
VLLAFRDGRERSLRVDQNVNIWMTRLAKNESRALSLALDRYAWIHVARGTASMNGTRLREGEGAGVGVGSEPADLLVFELT